MPFLSPNRASLRSTMLAAIPTRSFIATPASNGKQSPSQATVSSACLRYWLKRHVCYIETSPQIFQNNSIRNGRPIISITKSAEDERGAKAERGRILHHFIKAQTLAAGTSVL